LAQVSHRGPAHLLNYQGESERSLIMRIFVYNCNSYIGKALVKELRNAGDRGYNRIFGCQTAEGGAPTTVKRILTKDDPKKAKKMEEAIRSCGVVVFDLFNCTLKDLHFVLKALKIDPSSSPPRRTGDIEDAEGNKKESLTFILVSSAMVWANTNLDDIVMPAAPVDPDAPPPAEGEEGAESAPPPGDFKASAFNEKFFEQRAPVPGSRFEQWKEMENLVRTCFSLEGSQVKTYIVGAGVLYGDGEETFTQVFKDAWLGTQNHTITSPGTNLIPTVHVRDMARLVAQVCSKPELTPETTPYFLAVDNYALETVRPSTEADPAADADAPPPPTKVDADATQPTQAEIVKGIVGEINGPREIPMVQPPPPPAQLAEGEEAVPPTFSDEIPEAGSVESLTEAMALNLKMEPSSLMLDDTFEWHCRGGLLKNIRKVAEEFQQERKLRAMRVIIAGPPASGKSTVCKAVSDHFNIPLLSMNPKDLDATRVQLGSEVCRYRGYVLNAGLSGWQEVEELFCKDYPLPIDPDAEVVPPPDLEEGEEPPPPLPPPTERRLNEDGIVPAFAVMLQAPEALCRARFTAASKSSAAGVGVAEFQRDVAQFAEKNLADGRANFEDFFQDTAKIRVLNLPTAGKNEEDLFESTRIYMENAGRPFNYLKTAEEVADQLLAKQKEMEEIEAAKDELVKRQVTGSGNTQKEALNKRHNERLRIIDAHEAEQAQLEGLSLREYLMRYTVPNLTEGLIEMCMVLPESPVDYLANYLEQDASRKQGEN